MEMIHSKSENLFSRLAEYRTDFPSAIDSLKEAFDDAQRRRARLSTDETPLSIGIMGQVKAGKSSLLNMMLFGGRALLPEAATPKTANLTRIRHGRTPHYEAHFYTHDEWEALKKLAANPAQDAAARAARELVAHADAQRLDIQRLLVRGSEVVEAATIDELMGRLNDYTGSDGRYTPLVKHGELSLPMPELEGIEVVDTPGMNDPVLSRTLKTREYMSQCDVVFFLSRAGQFFDQSDQDIMSQQLPQKGVKRLVLVASQFDGIVSDDGFNRKSLAECLTRAREKLTGQAARNLNALVKRYEAQDNKAAAERLREALTKPRFISSFAQAYATVEERAWSAQQRHTHDQLQEIARDCWGGTKLKLSDWQELSGFEAIQEAYRAARDEKAAILAEQRATLERELQALFAELLDNLRARAQDRINTLVNSDVASLKDKQEKTQRRLDVISAALRAGLDEIISTARRRQDEVVADLRDAAQRAGDVQERTGYKSESYSVKIGGPVWYKPWTWFSEARNESYSETSSYKYVATADAIENLRYYIRTAERQLREIFADIDDVAVSITLRKKLLSSIDFNDPDFDPRSLRVWVEEAIADLELPKLEFSAPDVNEVFAGFGSELKSSSEISSLRAHLEETVSRINRELLERLDAGVSDVCQQLGRIATNLSAQLSAKLQQEMEQLRSAFADKEKNINRMKSLLAIVDTQRSAL